MKTRSGTLISSVSKSPKGITKTPKTRAPRVQTPRKHKLTLEELYRDPVSPFSLSAAYKHLKSIDSRFEKLIEKYPCTVFEDLTPVQNPFKSLIDSVVGQQVSGAAAKAILRRFVGLFSNPNQDDDFFPSPIDVIKTDLDTLRSAGLSAQKASYVTAIANAFASKTITPQMLYESSTANVVQLLTNIKGIGIWSAEMFLVFALKSPDILSTGDLAVQRGMSKWAGTFVDTKVKGKWKYMSEEDMLKTAEPYRPYRSLFMWYMWRYDGTDLFVENSKEKEQESIKEELQEEEEKEQIKNQD
ncbi:DNA-3-methyladenine glycosylase II [Acrasis kona]|uniref:DNA-3-methyladenine glycosylase II n=1 Tax=Acrasis kona TaxID=1008807 RepID=A0AAW2ZJC1_9EUKA